MKRKSKGKKALIVLLCLVLAGGAGFGAWYFLGNRGAEPVPVIPFYHVGMTEFWGDSQESYGFVQTDSVQTIYLSSTQNVTEVLVQEGQEVKKGDVLMTFDTTLSDLAVERKRLDVEKKKLQLLDAQKRLKEINAMRPMVIPQPSDDPEEDVDLGELLTESYQISHNTDFDGSCAEKALICWLHSSAVVDNRILDALILKAVEYQTINAEKEPEATEGIPEEPDATEETSEATEAPTEPEEVVVDHFYVVFKVTEGNYALGAKDVWQGIYVIQNPGGYSFTFFEAAMVQDHMLELVQEEEGEETPDFDWGSGYTAAQIAEMRADQEKIIKELEFEIKMAEANYKIALTEVSDGNVYAQIDGVVVSLISADEALMTQQPMIKVSAGGGFYVEGSVSELERESLVIGQEVTINDWSSGMTYVGRIESLGDYPSADGSWNGMGNPTASYYPFNVYVEESADLQSGSYVSIIFSAGTAVQGVYLENPFIRTENGRSYVWVRGADGKLEQRFVTTGKSLWGSYTQILDGVTAEDYLAFPYGKNLKAGAETVESDLSVLYE